MVHSITHVKIAFKMREIEFVESFSGDLGQRLNSCYQNLDKASEYKPDPMHDERHLAQVSRNANWIADLYELGPRSRKMLEQSIPLHDLGYSFVEMGFLKPEEHAIGSSLIALWKTGNHQLAKGVMLHSYDVLPKRTPGWICILREADRVDRLGWQGVIFAAYYMGFRHELVNGPLYYQSNLDGKEEVVDLLRDPRSPDQVDFSYKDILDGSYPIATRWTWTDYESKAAEFCKKYIARFLHERNLAGKMMDELWKVFSWIEGEEAGDTKAFRPKWKIEPASSVATYDFLVQRDLIQKWQSESLASIFGWKKINFNPGNNH